MIKKIFFLLCISFTINFAFADVITDINDIDDTVVDEVETNDPELKKKLEAQKEAEKIARRDDLTNAEKVKLINDIGYPAKEIPNGLHFYSGTDFYGMAYDDAVKLYQQKKDEFNKKHPNNNNQNGSNSSSGTNGSSGGAQTTPPNNNNQGGSNTGTQLNQPSNNNWSGANSNGGINGSNAGAQKIATAFTFGMTGIAFTILPFLFVCLTGYFRAKSGHNAQSISMTSTFGFAFIVHTFACVLFTLGIKCLDILSKIANESDYFSNKIFSIFWARSESAVYSLAGASGTIEDRGAYLELFIVQTAVDWLFIFLPILSFMTGFGYAMIELKQNRVEFNALSAISWSIGAGIISSLIYFAWAKIASIALFIPNSDILEFTKKLFDEILTI